MIYHIAYAADWDQARRDGRYAMSTKGRTLAEQGFIHASTAEQVAPVANMIYKGETGLVVLVIDPERVTSEIRWEQVPGEDDPFPHIYGPLDVTAVAGVLPLEPDAHGWFTFAT